MSASTRDRLRTFIHEQLLSGRAADPVGDDDDLLMTGVIDSLGAFSLVFFIEEEFGVDVPPQDVTIEHFSSIATIESYITARSG